MEWTSMKSYFDSTEWKERVEIIRKLSEREMRREIYEITNTWIFDIDIIRSLESLGCTSYTEKQMREDVENELMKQFGFAGCFDTTPRNEMLKINWGSLLTDKD